MAGLRRRGVVVLIVLLGLFCALVVVADRVAAYAAETTIASQAAQQMAANDVTSPAQPDVTVTGFPFLTQVLRGRYDQVTIVVDQPTAGGVTFDRITLVATGVHAALGAITSHQGQITADLVAGTAEISWQSVTSLLDLSAVPGVDLSTVQLSVVDDQIRLRIPIAVAGQRATLVATGSVAVAAGTVRLQVNQVTAEGSAAVPSGVTAQVKRELNGVEIRIPVLPYRLVVNRVQTTSSGIVATASAEGIVLAG